MKPRISLLLCAVSFALATRTSGGLIDQCSGIIPFRSVPYLRIAASLQALPKAELIRRIRYLAFTHQHEVQIIILCRMLFEAKPGGTFDAPPLGAEQYYFGTTSADWPLDPITIVDGVPFSIMAGTEIGGASPAGGKYFEYCLANLQWTTRRYAEPDRTTLAAALQHLIKSPVWKRPLTAEEIAYLETQLH